MTFGRSPDSRSSPGFGPAPASQLDAPFGGGAADGFGGRGAGPDGFGPAPQPLAAGPGSAATPDSERPVTHAELREHDERQGLVRTYQDMLGVRFEAMEEAIDTTCSALEVRRPKKTSLLGEMVNLAASAAIAGAAGVVAEILAKRLSAHVTPGFDVFKAGHQRFANDAIKEHLKKSFHLGIGARADLFEANLAGAFRNAQALKLLTARRQFFATFEGTVGHDLAGMSLPQLRAAVAAEQDAGARDAETIDGTSRQIAVEWANLVARVQHGAGGWDPWAGEHGSAHAVPTAEASGAPDFGPAAEQARSEHPSAGNVDPDSVSMRDIVDDDQRVMNPALQGVLEINLWGDELIDRQRHGRFRLYTRAGHGMRLAGVSDRVKQLVAGFAQVRDLKMNKVIAVYDNDELNPPKPVGRFLITADGYIRRAEIDGGEAEMANAAEFAQSLSPAALR